MKLTSVARAEDLQRKLTVRMETMKKEAAELLNLKVEQEDREVIIQKPSDES